MAQKRRAARKQNTRNRAELAAGRARAEKRLAMEARGREGHRTCAAVRRKIADQETPAWQRKKVNKILRAVAIWVEMLAPVAWPERKLAPWPQRRVARRSERKAAA